MRIAFAGVAHSHPFSDAANLLARGAEPVGVWDGDDPVRRRLFADRFAVPEFDTLPALLAAGADAVVATPRTPRASDVAAACAAAGAPVFFNKTVAADAAGLAAWEAIAHPRLSTSSVLRFAPELVRFAAELVDVRLHAVEVHAQHDIAGFLVEGADWQDDPAGAGGTLVNVGVHAWEMVDVLLPGGRAEIRSAWRTRGDAPTASELVGGVHADIDGISVSVTISGVGGPDRYAVRVWTDEGIRALVLADDADALGYGGTADAIAALARGGAAPVDPRRTSAVYRNIIAAAEAARSRGLGRPCGPGPHPIAALPQER
ncbi:hypothetical protein ACWGJP_05020 [Microbacterium sp. NPDC055903]